MTLFRPAIVLSVLGMLLVGLAALAAGWWFFIREDNKLATNAPEIPSDLVDSTAGAGGTAPAGDGASGDVLTFRVIPERSEAAYFAGETLASIGLPSTAKGSTNEIEGEFHLTPDGLALAPGTTSTFTVQLANLKSDQDRRDNRVREALAVRTYPSATFIASSVTGYDASIPAGEEQSLQLTGILDLHGVQREVTWDAKARREGDVFTALATVSTCTRTS
jgi:hypothetical protein